jgi:hypothetical protein
MECSWDRRAEKDALTILHHMPTIRRLVEHRAPPIIAQINLNEVLLRIREGELKRVKRKP